MRRTDLTILVSKPFKPSRLAIPPSPFSPRSPMTPHTKAQIASISTTLISDPVDRGVPPPPSAPLPWLWQCHVCRRVYSLGVTRRCLDDGHNFCSGTSLDTRKRRSSRRVARHQACASEFDYEGWQAWGDWRREVEAMLTAKSDGDSFEALPLLPAAPYEERSSYWPRRRRPVLGGSHQKNCWGNCNYPSECRWGKRPGVKKRSPTDSNTAGVATSTTVKLIESAKSSVSEPKTTFDEILTGAADASDFHTPVSSSQKDVIQISLSPQHDESGHTTIEPWSPVQLMAVNEAKPTRNDYMASVQRRKRRSLGQETSPLHLYSASSSETLVDVILPHHVYPRGNSGHKSSRSSASYLPRSFDDMDLAKVRRAVGYTNDLVLGFWDNMRHPAGPLDFGAGGRVERRHNSA